jgi:hypothetical protein
MAVVIRKLRVLVVPIHCERLSVSSISWMPKAIMTMNEYNTNGPMALPMWDKYIFAMMPILAAEPSAACNHAVFWLAVLSISTAKSSAALKAAGMMRAEYRRGNSILSINFINQRFFGWIT